MRKRLYPHPALGVLLWLQYLRYSPLAPHHELLWQRHRLLQVGVRKDNKKSRGRPLLFIFISVSACLKLAEYAKQDKKAIFGWMMRYTLFGLDKKAIFRWMTQYPLFV